MRLDRTQGDKRQKYALIKWRAFDAHMKCPDCTAETKRDTSRAVEMLINKKIVQYGNDFFVLKYKDQFAQAAFAAYVYAVRDHIALREKELLLSESQLERCGIEVELAELRPYLNDLRDELERVNEIEATLPT